MDSKVKLYLERSENEFRLANAIFNLSENEEIKKEEKISFQDIIHSVVEELIKNFSFKEVKFTAKYAVFGWPNILDEKDWKGDRGEELNRLTKRIKEVINI